MIGEKGLIARKLILTLLLTVCAVAIFYGAVALAAHIPAVSITDPADGADVSGVIGVSCDYSIGGGNVHTLILYAGGAEADRTSVNQKNGSYTFSLDTSMYAEGNLELKIEAHSAAPPAGHSSESSITVNIVNAACDEDADCDDGDDYTEDVCKNPGTPGAACTNEPIECLDAGDCDDGDLLTIDTCNDPGVADSSCANTAIECNIDPDCDDGNSLTADECLNAGTADSECSNIMCEISCNSDADCDDGDEITTDTCENAGTCGAACINVPCEVACENVTDCDDGDGLTIDSCDAAGTCNAACVNIPTACEMNADCNDGDALTIDMCLGGGTEDAVCQNIAIACNTNTDCDDGDEETNDSCENGGSESATCVNELIPVEPEPQPDPEPVELILEVGSPADGLVTNVSTVEVSGITTSGAALSINGTDILIDTDGSFTESISLNEGANDITVVAVLEGDTLTVTINVTLDTIAPSVLSSTPADGDELEVTPDTISIRIEDNPGGSGIDTPSVLVFLDGEDMGGNYNTGSYTYEASADIKPGLHTLEVIAADIAGNTLSETITFVKQGKGPKVKIIEVPGQIKEDEAEEVAAAPVPAPSLMAVEPTAFDSPEVTTSSVPLSTGAPWLDSLAEYRRPWDVEGFLELIREYEGEKPEIPFPPDAPDMERTFSGDIVAQVEEGDAPVDEETIKVTLDNEPVAHTFEPSTMMVTSSVEGLSMDAHSAEVTALDTSGEEGVAMAMFKAESEPVSVSNITLVNRDDPPAKTIISGEYFRIETEAVSGLSLTCAVQALTFSEEEGTTVESQQIFASAMTYDIQNGTYWCEGAATQPNLNVHQGDETGPIIGTRPAEMLIPMTLSGSEPIDLGDDMLTFHQNVSEVHLINSVTPSSSVILPGETFEVTAETASGRSDLQVFLADAAFFHTEEPGPVIVYQSELFMTEDPQTPGLYTFSGTLPDIPEGTDRVRALVTVIDHETGGFAADALPVISAEILDVTEPIPFNPPVIETVDGIAVDENNYVESDEYAPVVAGTAPENATVTIYEFIEGASSRILDTLAGGPAFSAVHTPGTLGYYGDDFEDENYTDKWEIGFSSGPVTVAEISSEYGGALVMTLPPGSELEMQEISSHQFEGNFSIQVEELEFPLESNPPAEEFSISVTLSGNIQVSESDYRNLSVIMSGNFYEGSVEVVYDGQTACSGSLPGVYPGAQYTISMDYHYGETPGVEVSINGNPLVTCDLPGAPSSGIVTATLGAKIDPQQATTTVNWGLYAKQVATPSGYTISAPAMTLNSEEYNTLGTGSGFYISPCAPALNPTVSYYDECTDGESDISAVLVTAYNVSSPPMAELMITFYSAGDPDAPGDDQYALVQAFLDTMQSQGAIESYSIDAAEPMLIAQGTGNEYLPAELPLITQEYLCTSQPGEPGYLRWNPNYYGPGQSAYLASYTPLEYDETVYNDLVVWGPDETGQGAIVLSGPDQPIWWADGSENVSAAIIYFENEGWNATGFGLTEHFPPDPVGLTFLAVVHNALIAPETPPGDYTWNEAALTAAGITIAPVQICTLGAFNEIAATTADASGLFSVQTAPFATDGLHIISARAELNGQTTDYSTSVTYNIAPSGPEDSTPPVITITKAEPDQISPASQTSDEYYKRFVLQADITDESDVDWRFSVISTTTPAEEVWSEFGTGYTVDTFWDGTVIGNGYADDGDYTIMLYAADTAPANNEAMQFLSVLVDNTPPTVEVNQPEAPIRDTITVLITAYDNSGGSGVESLSAAIDVSTPLPVTPLGGGEYEAALDTKLFENGIYEITAEAYDRAGSYSTDTISMEIANDYSPPTIEFIDPAEDLSHTNDPRPTVTIKVYDEDGGTGLYAVSSSGQGIPFIVTPDPYDSSLFRLDIHPSIPTPTQSAVLTFIPIAADNEGNTATASINIILDLDPPVIEETESTGMGFSDPMPTLEFHISEARPSDSGVAPESVIAYMTDGTPVDNEFTEATGLLSVTALQPLSSAEHTLNVEASDNVDNYSSFQWTFSIDSEPPAGDMHPQARPDSFAGTGDHTFDDKVYFTFTKISDNTGGTGIKTYYAEIDDGSQIDEPVQAFSGNTGLDTDYATVDGETSYCVVAEDYAGNRTEPQCDTIIVLAGRPGIDNVQDTPDPISPGNAEPDTSNYTRITADVIGTGTSYEWSVYIYDYQNSLVTTLPSGGPGYGNQIAVDWDGKDRGGDFVVPGSQQNYDYEIIATDLVTGVDSFTGRGSVTVDNKYPYSEITNLADQQQVTATSYNVEIFVLEEVGVEQVQFCVDDNPCAEAELIQEISPAAWSYMYEWPVSQEGAGWHTIIAKVTDTAKNTADSAPLDVHLGQMPVPEVTITSPEYNTPVHLDLPVVVSFKLKQGKVKRLELFISSDGENYDSVELYSLANPGLNEGEHTFTLDTDGGSYPDGYYYLKATAYKNDDQFAESPRVKILIDNMSPTIEEVHPQNNALISLTGATAPVQLSATINPHGGSILDVNTINLTLDGNPVQNSVVSVQDGNLLIFASPTLNLTANEYNAEVEISDSAGNTVSTTWEFVVQGAPSITGICPTSGTAASSVTLAVDNIPVAPEYYTVTLNYIDYSTSPAAIDSHDMQIVSIGPDTITALIPSYLQPSDPTIHIAYQGPDAGSPVQYSNGLKFRILENPVDENNLIYVLNRGSRDISVVDLTNELEVARIDSARGLIAGSGLSDILLTDPMSNGNRYVFALNGGDNLPEDHRKLNVIDTACNSVTHTIDGISGHKLLLSPAGDKLYIFDLNGTYILDTELAVTGAGESAILGETSYITASDAQFGMDAQDIFITRDAHFRVDDELLLTEPQNSILDKRITPSGYDFESPILQELTPDGKHLIGYWEVENQFNRLFIISLDTNGTVATYPIDGLTEMQIHPGGRYIYALTDEQEVVLLDLQEMRTGQQEYVLSAIGEIGGFPLSLNFSNDGSIVYVTQINNTLVEDMGELVAIDHEESIRNGIPVIYATMTVGTNPVTSALPIAPKPQIDSIDPNNAYVEEKVLISGSNFCQNARNNIVVFESQLVSPVKASSDEIIVRVPVNADSGDVYVGCNGRLSNPISFTINNPEITSISPEEIGPETIVVITGNGFSISPDNNEVYFESRKGDVLYSSEHILRVRTPFEMIPGSVQVVVYGKTSNSAVYSLDAPDLEIQTPLDSQNFTIADDTDGNPRNGIQIDIITISNDLPNDSQITLKVNERDILVSGINEGEVHFSAVTLYPTETVIKAYYRDDSRNQYAEDIVTLTVNLPDEEMGYVAYSCTGECLEGFLSTQQQLFTLNLSDSTTTTIMGSVGGTWPSWDDSGKRIVFSKKDYEFDILGTDYIYIADIENDTSYPLSYAGVIQEEPMKGIAAAWSPDGDKIAYYSYAESGGYNLNIVSVNNNSHIVSGPTEITTNLQTSLHEPVWSPAGRFLYFADSDGMKRTIVHSPNDITDGCDIDQTGVFCQKEFDEGTHVMILSSEDDSGFPAKQKSIVFTVDITEPYLSIYNYSNLETVYADSIEIIGTVSDDISEASVTVNGFQATKNGDVYFYTGLSLDEGSNLITVQAVDEAGNISEKSILLYSTQTAGFPVVLNTSVQTGDVVQTENLWFTALISDSMQMIADGSVRHNGNSVECSLSGSTELEINCSIQLNDGSHSIQMSAYDSYGTKILRESIVFVYDTQPPTAQIQSLSNGDRIYGNSIDIAGRASDDTTDVSWIMVNGITASVAGGAWIAYDVPLTDGDNEILVEAMDEAGNYFSETITINAVTVTESSSSISVGTPGNLSVNNNGNVTISASFSSGIATDTVRVLNGANVLVPEVLDTPAEGIPLDWVPGTGAVAASLLKGISFIDVATGISIPVYESMFQDIDALIQDVTMGSSIDKLVFTDYENSGLAANGYMLDVNDSNLTHLGVPFLTPDWWAPKPPIYNSVPPTISDMSPADRSYSRDLPPVIQARIVDDLGEFVCEIESWKLVIGTEDVTDRTSFDRVSSVMTFTAKNEEFTFGDQVAYRIQATDCVGNTSGWEEVTFRIGYPTRFINMTPKPGGATNELPAELSADLLHTLSYEFSQGEFVVDGNIMQADFATETETLSTYAMLDEGQHTVKVRAFDTLDFVAQREWSFYIDRDAPAVTDIYPSDYDRFGQSIPNCTAIVSDGIDGSGINIDPDRLYVTLYSGNIIEEYPMTYIRIGTEDNTGTLVFNPPDLSDGQSLAVAHVEDNAGNVKEFTWKINVDSSVSSITVVHPLPNTEWNTTITEIEVVMEPDDNDEVTFLLNNEYCLYEKTHYNMYSCPVSLVPPVSGEQVASATVRIEDSLGNSNEVSWQFTLTSAPPDPAFTEPEIEDFAVSPRLFNITNGESATISYSLTHDSFVTMKLYEVDAEANTGALLYTLLENAQEPTGAYSHTWDGTVTTASGTFHLPPAAYRISFEARLDDPACNPNCMSASIPDIIPSDLSLIEFSEHLSIKPLENQLVPITYNLNYPTIVNGVLGKADGPVDLILFDAIPQDSATQTLFWNGRVDDGILLQETKYDFILTFYPLMNNSVIIEAESPEITAFPERELIFNPAAAASTTVSFNLSDYNPGATMTLFAAVYDLDNVPVKTLIDGASAEQGTNTVSWDGTDNTGDPVENDTYSIAIHASNADDIEAQPVYLAVQVQKPELYARDGVVYVFGNPGDQLSDLIEDPDTTPNPLIYFQTETSAGTPLLEGFTDITSGTHTYSFSVVDGETGITYTQFETFNFDQE